MNNPNPLTFQCRDCGRRKQCSWWTLMRCFTRGCMGLDRHVCPDCTRRGWTLLCTTCRNPLQVAGILTSQETLTISYDPPPL